MSYHYIEHLIIGDGKNVIKDKNANVTFDSDTLSESHNFNIRYKFYGNTVMLSIPDITIAPNTNFISLRCTLPLEIRPTTNIFMLTYGRDFNDNVTSLIEIYIQTNGLMIIVPPGGYIYVFEGPLIGPSKQVLMYDIV